jgi:hypothetical protein
MRRQLRNRCIATEHCNARPSAVFDYNRDRDTWVIGALLESSALIMAAYTGGKRRLKQTQHLEC